MQGRFLIENSCSPRQIARTRSRRKEEEEVSISKRVAPDFSGGVTNFIERDVAVKIAARPGGYTRILKTGFRPSDNAEMCFIELVD